MTREPMASAKCAEKSDMSAICGEIVAPSASSVDEVAEGLRAMNMLRIPKAKPLPSRARKRRESFQPARLELTLEMPRERPSRDAGAVQEASEKPEQDDAPQRGVADVDFYI